jgi:hypothetical protein
MVENAVPKNGNVLVFPEVTVKGTAPKNRIPMAFLPFVPVPFSGENSLWAYVRLGLYGGAAVLTWEKYRKISYVMIAAAGLSTLTSLGASAMEKSNA